MRILALSDTHGRLPELDVSRADCVMIAGDVCPDYNHLAEYQKIWLENIFSPWVEKIEKPVYFTLGNHDFLNVFEAPPNLRYGTEAVCSDVMLFSWTPRFYNWAWMADEKVLAEKLEALLACGLKPSIWLTHGPPWGVCDLVRGPTGGHAGSHALRKAIEDHQPRLVICGHIHEAAGAGRLGKTPIYNVSVLDASNAWHGRPVLIEL